MVANIAPDRLRNREVLVVMSPDAVKRDSSGIVVGHFVHMELLQESGAELPDPRLSHEPVLFSRKDFQMLQVDSDGLRHRVKDGIPGQSNGVRYMIINADLSLVMPQDDPPLFTVDIGSTRASGYVTTPGTSQLMVQRQLTDRGLKNYFESQGEAARNRLQGGYDGSRSFDAFVAGLTRDEKFALVAQNESYSIDTNYAAIMARQSNPMAAFEVYYAQQVETRDEKAVSGFTRPGLSSSVAADVKAAAGGAHGIQARSSRFAADVGQEGLSAPDFGGK